MSKSIPVHIYFVLDESGSMASIASDVVGGFNTFLAEQQAQPGKCRLTMVKFEGSHFVLLHEAVDIKSIKPMSSIDFRPGGGTPLLDAEGRTIALAQRRQDHRARAGKVEEAILFATFTDGEENQSREWTFESLSAKKAELEEKEGWAFTYLGVGLDRYAHGSQSTRAGTQVLASVHNAADSAGVADTYSSLSVGLSNVRGFAARGERIGSASVYAGTGVKTIEEDDND